MITLWLIELFTTELAVLRNNKQGKSKEYTVLQDSFKQFLLQPIIQVNSKYFSDFCGTLRLLLLFMLLRIVFVKIGKVYMIYWLVMVMYSS